MKKRILSVLLALVLTLGLLPVSVLAAEMAGEPEGTETATPPETENTVFPELEEVASPESSEEGSVEQETVWKIPELPEDFPDNDELFLGYVWQTLYGGESVTYGNYGETYFSGNVLSAYKALKESVTKIANGTQTSAKITVNVPYNSISAQINSLLTVLMADCPYEMYWFDKTAGWVYTSGSASSVTFSLAVAEAYSDGITETITFSDGSKRSYHFSADKTKTGATSKAVNAANAIVAKYSSLSDYDKLVAYKNEICALVDYNWDALEKNPTYGDPWQLIYVFDGDPATKVVCEGYSKAFQYLCDLSQFIGSVTCYTVSGQMAGGTGSGGHMWNIVTIDGQNYLVDVTNSDVGSAGQGGGLFLAVPDADSTWNGTMGQYNFTAGSSRIAYAYDADTIAAYGKSILQLAATPYTPADVESITLTAEPSTNVSLPASGSTVTVTLKAAAAYTGGSTKDVTASTNWSAVLYSNWYGVTLNGNVLTIGPDALNWQDYDETTKELVGDIHHAASREVPVTAKYGGKEATIKITISKDPPKLASIVISGPDAITVGAGAAVYTAAGKDQYGADITVLGAVTWSVAGLPDVTIDQKGQLTVPANSAGGTVTITAASGGLTAAKTVEIERAASVATSVVIVAAPGSLTVPTVTEAQIGTVVTTTDSTVLAAKVLDQYGTEIPGQTITWSVSGNPGVSVSGGKLAITNKATGAAVTLTAGCGTCSATKTIVVNRTTASAAFVKVTGAASITIQDSGTNTETYTAAVYDQYGEAMTGQTVTWAISGNDAGVTQSGGAISVAPSAADHQIVTLTATVGGKSGAITVSINKLPPHTFTAMTDKTVTFGDPPFTQAARFSCCSGASVTYSSSDMGVATVDNAGRVTIVGAGTATITAAKAGTATHAATTDSYTLTVKQRDIGSAAVAVTGTFTYNGSEHTPDPTVTLGGRTLVKGTDYEVSHDKNTNAGRADVTVTGKGSYTGSKTINFTIIPVTLALSIKGDTTKVYDGTNAAPAGLSIELGGIISGDNVSATASFAYDSANAGARTITASGITLGGAAAATGNYRLSQTTITTPGTITRAAQNAPAAPTAADADIKDVSITLTEIPGAQYSMDGATWQDSAVFTGLSPNTQYTFYARMREDNNHTASVSSTGAVFTTKKTMLSGAVVTVGGSYTYNGAAQVPAANQVTVTLRGVVIASDQYTISATGNTDAGTATVTVTAKPEGNYSGAATGSFTIAKAAPTITWGTATQELIYDGSPAAVTAPTVTLVNGETFSGTITYSYAAAGSTRYTNGLPANAGTYTVKAGIAEAGNYTAAQSSNTLSLTIQKSTPVIKFKEAYIPDRAYNGTSIANPAADDLEVTGAQFSAVKFAWTKDGKTAAPTSAGTYILTASIAETANTGAASAAKDVTITPAAVTVTPDSGQHKEYGAADPTLTYKVTAGQLFGSDRLTGKLAYTGENVGTYEIRPGTLTATANYTLTIASGVMFEITKPTLENATVTLSASRYTYDGAAKVPAVTVKKGSQTVDPSEYDVTYSNTNGGEGNNINAGTVTLTVTAKDDGNYHGAKSAVFTIAPKPVTAVVTAANKVYDGTTAAVVTAGVNGGDLVSGDSITITGLTGTFNNANAGTGKTVTVNRSGASITGSGKDNYAVTIPTSTKADITKAVITIAWANPAQTMDYTGSQAAITAPAVSAQNDVAVSVTPRYSYAVEDSETFTSGLPTNAGTYTVRASVAESGNLTEASADMTLTISPKNVVEPVIQISPSTFVYDGTEKKPTVTIRDGGKVIPASEYKVTYSGNVNAGTATITIENVAGNYTVSGTQSFTITAKPLTGARVSVSDKFTYNGSAHTPDPTVTLGGRTLVKGTDYTVEYAGNTSAGTAAITITGKDNYSGTATGSFTIAKATLAVNGTGAASGTYGAKLSELAVSGLTAVDAGAGTEIAGTWAIAGDAVPNVGDGKEYTAVFTPAAGADNYTALTAQVKLSIAKADYSDATTARTSAKSGAGGVYALTALLPEWGVPGTISTSGGIFEDAPSVSGRSLSYKLKADAAAGSTGAITIPVTSTNYNDFSLTITVTVTDKDVPTLSVSGITVTYNGEAVPEPPSGAPPR